MIRKITSISIWLVMVMAVTPFYFINKGALTKDQIIILGYALVAVGLIFLWLFFHIDKKYPYKPSTQLHKKYLSNLSNIFIAPGITLLGISLSFGSGDQNQDQINEAPHQAYYLQADKTKSAEPTSNQKQENLQLTDSSKQKTEPLTDPTIEFLKQYVAFESPADSSYPKLTKKITSQQFQTLTASSYREWQQGLKDLKMTSKCEKKPSGQPDDIVCVRPLDAKAFVKTISDDYSKLKNEERRKTGQNLPNLVFNLPSQAYYLTNKDKIASFKGTGPELTCTASGAADKNECHLSAGKGSFISLAYLAKEQRLDEGNVRFTSYQSTSFRLLISIQPPT